MGKENRMSDNIFNFDGDHRKEPKTDFFCAVCQRDIADRRKAVYVWLHQKYFDCVVRPDKLDGSEILVPVGSECKKKIPVVFIVRINQ
jgi:hypothetical protein